MKPRPHDPRRLDVAVFAADAERLEGRWPVAALTRLSAAAPADAPADAPDVSWSARGELRRPYGVEPEIRLHLAARAAVWLECQRCLRPVRVELAVERGFRFVADEDAAASLDADSDDDVLELTRTLDLRDLVEDELLLALPLVPRHERCPVTLPTRSADPAPADAPHPFAALEALKRGRSSG